MNKSSKKNHNYFAVSKSKLHTSITLALLLGITPISNIALAAGAAGVQLGSGATASIGGPAAVAIGQNAAAMGTAGIAIGGMAGSYTAAAATAPYTVALGTGAKADAARAVSIGTGAGAYGYGSVALQGSTHDQATGGVAIGSGSAVYDDEGTRAELEELKKNPLSLAKTTISNAGVYQSDGGEARLEENVGLTPDNYTHENVEISKPPVYRPGTHELLGGTAVGYNAVTSGSHGTSIGVAARSFGFKALAVGATSVAISDSSTAVGSQSIARNPYTIAMGYDSRSFAYAGIAIGEGAQVREGAHLSTAVGQFARATTWNSVALGAQSSTEGIETSKDLVAKFSGETVKANSGVVSVGTKAYVYDSDTAMFDAKKDSADGTASADTSTKISVPEQYRRIVNVAGGVEDNDAVNVRQLTSAVTAVANSPVHIYSKGSEVSPTGNASQNPDGGNAGAAPSYNISNLNFNFTDGIKAENEKDANGNDVIKVSIDKDYMKSVQTQGNPNGNASSADIDKLKKRIDGNAAQISQLNNRVDRVTSEMRGIGANVAAGIALPQSTIPGKSMIAVSAGQYKGASAVALGWSHMSDNTKVIVKFSGTVNSEGNVSGGVGMGYHY